VSVISSLLKNEVFKQHLQREGTANTFSTNKTNDYIVQATSPKTTGHWQVCQPSVTYQTHLELWNPCPSHL